MDMSRHQFASLKEAAADPECADRANLDEILELRSNFRWGRFGVDFGANFGTILRAQNKPAD